MRQKGRKKSRWVRKNRQQSSFHPSKQARSCGMTYMEWEVKSSEGGTTTALCTIITVGRRMSLDYTTVIHKENKEADITDTPTI